jgi:hypothetical protein
VVRAVVADPEDPAVRKRLDDRSGGARAIGGPHATSEEDARRRLDARLDARCSGGLRASEDAGDGGCAHRDEPSFGGANDRAASSSALSTMKT